MKNKTRKIITPALPLVHTARDLGEKIGRVRVARFGGGINRRAHGGAKFHEHIRKCSDVFLTGGDVQRISGQPRLLWFVETHAQSKE